MIKTTLRPGLLVSLRTSVRGNVSYAKEIIESERVLDSGEAKEKWQTERTIEDPIEWEAAGKVRSKVRGLIAATCANSAHGLICPLNRSDDLDRAIVEAEKLATAFNATAKLTRFYLHVVTGEVAADDARAIKAINSEVRELLEDMAEGVRNVDPKQIRDAANRARSLGQMLTPEAGVRIEMAITAARTAARQIVKAGEAAAIEVDRRAIALITESRTAFLEIDDAGKSDVAAPAAEARAVDFEASETIRVAAPAAPAIEF